MTFEVAGIELKNVSLEVDDRQTSTVGKVVLQSFDSGRIADGLKTDVKLKATVSLSKPAPANLNVQGSLSLTPQLAQNTVLVDKLALDLDGDAAGVKQMKAALKADAGDTAGALALYSQVAGDGAADPLLRDLASYYWAMRQIETGDPATLEARLAPLAGADHPLRALAAEAQALVALRQDKADAAREILRKLGQDVTAPDGVRARANGLLAQLGGSAAP